MKNVALHRSHERDPENHRRLILFAMIPLLPPGINRTYQVLGQLDLTNEEGWQPGPTPQLQRSPPQSAAMRARSGGSH